MDERNAIEVAGVGKRFKLYRSGVRTLKSAVLDLLRTGGGHAPFWALRDVSFTVAQGEALGIIGANGAGKSTLLAIVAGTLQPTEGRVRADGVIASLLELGAGFHPDLTGRENVFLWGAIMGLKRAAVRRRFDAIVDFAGIGDYIDQPVKHYSSGMYVRLGFAVAVEVDPDILLVDEVLAVGDAAFQRKCVARMQEFRRRRKTMLVISHDLATIQSISDRIILLDGGRVIGDGAPAEIVDRYEAQARGARAGGLGREWGTREAEFAGVELRDAAGRATAKFRFGEPLEAVLRYRAARRIEEPVFGFALCDEQGRLIFGSNTQIEGFSIPFIEGAGALALRLERLPVARGTYLLSFSLHSADHRTNYHRLDHAFPIAVEAESHFEGVAHIPCRWSRP